MSDEVKLGFIGAGNMARAIIQGLVTSARYSPHQIMVSHPSAASHRPFGHLNIHETVSNIEIAQSCNVLVLCIKPQIVDKVAKEIAPLVDAKRPLILSILAGVSLAKLEALFGSGSRITRCTLNTAATIGCSCAVFSRTATVADGDCELVREILSAVGECLGEIKDAEMDAATSVCASSIAYMYMMCDAIADGGVKTGLSKAMALRMAAQTMVGAARLLQTSGRNPNELKDAVCSPGGITIQGVHELEKANFRSGLMSAVEAAVIRSRQFN
jgi:pyrroline-5-carboxylate reductase